eukprot:scaffold853_cov386-Prasinococcus_capsulatus_cf.AAC.9
MLGPPPTRGVGVNADAGGLRPTGPPAVSGMPAGEIACCHGLGLAEARPASVCRSRVATDILLLRLTRARAAVAAMQFSGLEPSLSRTAIHCRPSCVASERCAAFVHLSASDMGSRT